MKGYKVWSGRFSEEPARLLEEFNASIGFDWVLYKYDIEGSKAWAEALERAGVITSEELDKIIKGLSEIAEEIEQGRFQFSSSLEDIHMHVEARLFELVGDPAKKLHTGRSRNDQVALDLRMYVKDRIDEILGLLREFLYVILKKADAVFGVALPSYTHLQRAQPVLLSHHLLAYYEMFKRDRERFVEARKRADILPLGSGATSGTTVPVNREWLAKRLGFSEVSRNSMDAVSDRDFILDFLYASSTTFVHLSRLSEELIIWSTSEFSFVEIPDRYATGSSMMPQKKNPDIPELIRAKASKAISCLSGMMILLKGLPLCYNKDLQEDKFFLFSVSEDLSSSLRIVKELTEGLSFKKENMERAVSDGFLLATDLADYLVFKKGVPFRDAHSIVGKVVSYAASKGKTLSELSLDELRKFFEGFDSDVFSFLTVESSLKRRAVLGGTSPERVKEEIRRAYEEMEEL